MADWFTDNILGNNANPGTAVSPFKTIAHAFSVASNNDEIYVAGSATTALPGTATPRANNGQDTGPFPFRMVTTDDLTGLLNAGDVIEFTDSVTGKAFYVAVTGVLIGAGGQFEVGTTNNLIPFCNTTFTLRKFDTVHYGIPAVLPSAPTTLENITSLKSGIKISGGWDSTFTNQIGYTWFRGNVATTNPVGLVALAFANTTFPWNIKIERFGWAHMATAINTMSATLSNNTITGDLAMSNVTSGGLRGVYTTENQPDLYLFNAPLFGFAGRPSTSFDLTTGQPSFSVNEVVNCSTTTSLATASTVGHFAVNTWTAVVGHFGQTSPPTGTIILGNLFKLVINSLQIYQLPTSRGSVGVALATSSQGNVASTYQIKDLDVYGVAVQLGITFGQSFDSALFDITLVGKNLMDIPWTTTSQNTNSYINGLQRGQAMIKADDGTAVLRGFQLYQTDSTEFDTGSNSLKWNKKTVDSLNAFPATGAIDNIVLADFIAETGKTINIRVKLEAPHTQGLIQFKLVCMENPQTIGINPGIGFFNDTTWVTFSIPLTAAGPGLSRLLDRHCQLTLEVANNGIDAGITAIYIDSVEIV